MDYSPQAAARVLSHAADVLHNDEPDTLKVRRLWHVLTALRANLLARALKDMIGSRVLSGPFKGMQLTEGVMVKISVHGMRPLPS